MTGLSREDLDSYLKSFVSGLDSCIKAPWIREAFLKVPRHLFIDQFPADGKDGFVKVDRARPSPEHLGIIYSGRGLPIKSEPHSAASEPGLVALMLGHLEIGKGMKVFEIGTGSGFNSGLMTVGTGDPRLVHSIDIQPDLVERAGVHLHDAGIEGVNLRAGDGGLGWSEKAPFDRIMVTVGSSDIPPAWQDQLADGGMLLVPFKTKGVGDPLLRLRRSGSGFSGGFVGYSWFNALQGSFHDTSELAEEMVEGPQVKALLDGPEAGRIDLEGYDQADFLLFRRALGLAPLEEGWIRREDGAFFLLLDRNANQAFVWKWREKGVSLRGSPDPAGALSAALARWEAAGRPAVTDYRAEVVREGAAAGPGEWIERRPHVTLKLALMGKGNG